jgi:ABC-type Fe3+/spermidine/putrescine transport system ATPase subunit
VGSLGARERRAVSAPFLEVRGLSKAFAGHEVLKDLTLEVAAGEIVALLGRSGSGKTTALRLLAGLETPDRGTVRVAGEDVTRRPAARRGIGMVFQSYALFPHLSIGENVSFGLEGGSLARPEIRRRAEAALAKVRLEGRFVGRVGDLSGGMQQRVAIARALAPEPRVLLLDEPFSNLDPELREHTRRELRAQIHAIGITTLFVTHDQEEAFDLGDRVALLEAGRLEQVGTPEDLYRRPQSAAVARFIGRSSWLEGTIEAVEERRLAVRLAAAGVTWPASSPAPLAAGASTRLCIRPEALTVTPDPNDPRALAGAIEERRFLGGTSLYSIRLDGAGDRVEVAGEPGLEPGAPVRVGLRPGADLPIAFPASDET